MKKTDIETENKVIELYNSGKSCNNIASILSINSVTVFNILKRNNIRMRTKGGIYKLPSDKIISDYKDGIKIQNIARKYSVNDRTIYNYLEENKIDRNYIYKNKSLKRDYFKNIDTYDKAYFLGFLIADGCVIGNNIQITLKKDDDDILIILSKYICNENPIYYSKRNEATLHFKSEEIKKDLAKYGVVERKTSTAYLPILEEHLMPHLIRGLIDGDGWITKKNHVVGFCGNQNIVTSVRDYMVFALNTYNVKVMHPEINLWQISWASKKDFLTICNYLYNDKYDCFLKRKYQNFIGNTEVIN